MKNEPKNFMHKPAVDISQLPVIEKTETYEVYSKIKIFNKSFRLMDFNNEWTFRHSQEATPLITQILAKAQSIADITQKQRPEEMLNQLNAILDNNLLISILAMIYTDSAIGEERYNDEVYNSRKETFRDAPLATLAIAENGLIDFFDIVVPSMFKNSQTYLVKAATAIIQKPI